MKLFRCRICGDPYIGEKAPSRCPFCGAYEEFIVEAKDYNETFDVTLSEKDKANAEKALQVEVSNAAFYFCAAEKTDTEEGKKLFKALGKVEAEHASIWKKILKLDKAPEGSETCFVPTKENLQESHNREDRAIKFYKQAAEEADDARVKQLFKALVDVETDHLQLSEERLN
ncbi:MAG: ferritin [bacterium]|nr:ferritin [bacterium]